MVDLAAVTSDHVRSSAFLNDLPLLAIFRHVRQADLTVSMRESEVRFTATALNKVSRRAVIGRSESPNLAKTCFVAALQLTMSVTETCDDVAVPVMNRVDCAIVVFHLFICVLYL